MKIKKRQLTIRLGCRGWRTICGYTVLSMIANSYGISTTPERLKEENGGYEGLTPDDIECLASSIGLTAKKIEGGVFTNVWQAIKKGNWSMLGEINDDGTLHIVLPIRLRLMNKRPYIETTVIDPGFGGLDERYRSFWIDLETTRNLFKYIIERPKTD